MPIQFLITAFAFFAVARAWQSFRGGTLDRRKLLLWALFWVAVVVVILSPGSTVVIANALGVGRGTDLAVYVSILLLFYGLFQQSRKVDRLEASLTGLVRALALRDRDKEEGDAP